jgi:prevent-host-death family protein
MSSVPACLLALPDWLPRDAIQFYILEGRHMKTVSARQASDHFSELLSRVERGEEILITKRSKPVALLSPYRPPRLTPQRRADIDHAR